MSILRVRGWLASYRCIGIRTRILLVRWDRRGSSTRKREREMFGTAIKKTALLGLLVAGTTGTLAAQEELRPSDTWNVPTCNRIVGTPAVTYTTDEGAT